MATGRVHIPAFKESKPLVRIASIPSRKQSSHLDEDSVLTEADLKKNKLLKSVVYEEEVRTIVSRLSRPTVSSSMKHVQHHPRLTYVDMGYYRWTHMPQYIDYQRTIFSPLGSIKPSFRRTVKRYN